MITFGPNTDAFIAWWSAWWIFYLAGYLGLYLHLSFKVPKEQHIHDWVRANVREFVASVICYNLCVFLWADGTLEFVGLAPSSPNLLTFVLAYFGQSIVMAVLFKFGSQIDAMLEKFRGGKETP